MCLNTGGMSKLMFSAIGLTLPHKNIYRRWIILGESSKRFSDYSAKHTV